MAETTEDLVQRFSTAPKHDVNTASAYSGRPFEGDQYLNLGPFDDPLDDPTETRSSRIPSLAFPPTPKRSPYKVNMDRLRGSPVKTPRRRFPAPVNLRTPMANIDDNRAISPFSGSEFDENFDPLTVFNENQTSKAKELNGYQALLSSSTNKLTNELRLEKERSGKIERELAELRLVSLDANRLKSDVDSLRGENQTLRARNLSLEMQINKFQRGDKSEQFARENKLLREKLLKYKKLYDASVKGVKFSQEKDKNIGSEMNSNEQSTGNVEKNNESSKTLPSGRLEEHDSNGMNSSTLNRPPTQNFAEKIENTNPGPSDLGQAATLLEYLRRVLALLESERSDKSLTSSEPDSVSVSLKVASNQPETTNPDTQHKQSEIEENERNFTKESPSTDSSNVNSVKIGQNNVNKSQSDANKAQHKHRDCENQFARLEKLLLAIQNELRHSSKEKPIEQSVAEIITNKQSRGSDHYCVCVPPNTQKSQKRCSACSSVSSSGVPTRPQSESTPKETENTDALRGRFSWNQTV